MQELPLEPIKQEMQELEEINTKVRENQRYTEAKEDSEKASKEVAKLTNELEKVRDSKKSLLDNAKLPLEGLSIDNGVLVYNGDKWDCMASSDQLKVSVAIVRSLYPKCGFVLMDKLEQFDKDQLAAFSEWLVSQDLQVIGTRVATGDECSIIIEDGKIKE